MDIVAMLGTIIASLAGSSVLSAIIVALINRKRDNKKAEAEIKQQDADQKLEEQAAEISYSEKAVQLAYGLLPRLREEIDALKKEIVELKISFSKQTEIISGQLQRIIQLQSTMENQNVTIKNMQKVMMEKDGQLAEKDMKLSTMAIQIIERDSTIVHLQSEIHVLQTKVERLEKIQTGELHTPGKGV